MRMNKELNSYIVGYLEALDTPHSLAIWILFKSGEHKALLDLKLDPNWFNDVDLFRRSFLASSFLKKSDFLNAYSSTDRRELALKKFLECEVTCRQTNQRLKTCSKEFDFPEADALFFTLRRKITSTLMGSEDKPRDISYEEIAEHAGWGPGATTLTSGDTSDVNKFRSEGGATQACYELISAVHKVAYPGWDVPWSIVPGCKVITVPKNSKIDRVIAIEPGINLWYQKAIGKIIRNRLLRCKIDLKNQAFVNQRLALKGSKDSYLATVDFSSASDTISLELVRQLLPSRWLSIMEAFRSSHAVYDGQVLRLEKFSSMGNGFTFELESLIFYSAAVAVCQHLGLSTEEVSIFGDDVILPSQAVDLFSRFCRHLGFSVNQEKSFSSGCFRESCGAYYFRGVDCKPFYLRKVVESDSDKYLFANSVRRIAHRFTGGLACHDRFKDIWTLAYQDCKRKLFIPDGYGDGGLISNFDEARPSRLRNGMEGYLFRINVEVPVPRHDYTHSLLLARLSRRSEDRESNNAYSIRGRVRSRLIKTSCYHWPNLGPWL